MINLPVEFLAGEVERPSRPRAMLRDTLNTLFYYRRAAIAILAGATLLGLAAALLMPARYTAHAQLLALAADVYDAQAQGSNVATQKVLDPAVIANVEMQILGSEELHREIVKQAMPGATADAIDAATVKFDKALHITKVADANVIDLAYTAPSAEEAADALRRLLKTYLVQRAAILTGERTGFLSRQRDDAKAKLDQADAEIARFQQSHGIVDIAGQTAAAVSQNADLRKQLEAANASMADAGSTIARLKAEAATQPRQVELYSDNTEAARAMGEMQQSLLELRAKRSDLASRFMAGSPRVVLVDKQIAGLERAIATQKRELMTTKRVGRNDFYYSARDRLAQAEAAAAGTRARAGALSTQVSQSRASLQSLIGVSDTLSRMRLQRDVLASAYRDLAAQVEQARVQLDLSSASGGTNVRVIEAPVPPARRSNPPLLAVAAGLFIGLLLAGGIVFLLSSLRETFLNTAEAERAFGLPVLASPLAAIADDRAAMRRALGGVVGLIDLLPRTSGRLVLLLSPAPAAVSTEAASALAGALVDRRGQRVLLLSSEAGAFPVVGDGGVVVRRLNGIDSATVPVTLPVTNADFVAEVRERYDTVVLTAPPTVGDHDGVDLARICDMTLIAIEAERTRQPLVEDLIARLRQLGIVPAGMVMMRRRQHVPGALYRLLFTPAAPAAPTATIEPPSPSLAV